VRKAPRRRVRRGEAGRPGRLAALALVSGLGAASLAAGDQWIETPYRGVRVVAFDKRETRRLFGVRGTMTIAFDGYAPDVEAVLVLTTKQGPCVDSGRMDASGVLPMIRLNGRCRGISGLILGSDP
jgi:hypothetical protein